MLNLNKSHSTQCFPVFQQEYCITGVSNFHAQQETNPLEVCKTKILSFEFVKAGAVFLLLFFCYSLQLKMVPNQFKLCYVEGLCTIILENCLMPNGFWLYNWRIFRLFVSNKHGNLTGRRHPGLIHKPSRPSKCNVYSIFTSQIYKSYTYIVDCHSRHENYEWTYGICIIKKWDINQTTSIFYMI